MTTIFSVFCVGLLIYFIGIIIYNLSQDTGPSFDDSMQSIIDSPVEIMNLFMTDGETGEKHHSDLKDTPDQVEPFEPDEEEATNNNKIWSDRISTFNDKIKKLSDIPHKISTNVSTHISTISPYKIPKSEALIDHKCGLSAEDMKYIQSDFASQLAEQKEWLQHLSEEALEYQYQQLQAQAKITIKQEVDAQVAKIMAEYVPKKQPTKFNPPSNNTEPTEHTFFYIPNDMEESTALEYCTYLGGVIQ